MKPLLLRDRGQKYLGVKCLNAYILFSIGPEKKRKEREMWQKANNW